MQPDVRETPLYSEISDLYRRLSEPFGAVVSASDLSAAPDGTRVAFTGSRRDAVDKDPVSRVCVLDVASGAVEEVTAGPGSDRLPRWSPDGTTIAFLSDRGHEGRFGLFLLESGRLGEAWAAPDVDGSVEWLVWSPDGTTIAFLSDRGHEGRFGLFLLESGRLGEAWAAPDVDGSVEWLVWSPDGRALLLGVAGAGAEKAGVEGSGRVKSEGERPDWLPQVTTNDESALWRRAWRYDVASRALTPLSREGLNVWEATWCGPDTVAAIVSESPGEDAWYDAPLALLDVATGQETVVHRAREGRQLGWPAATADGSRLAVVEARCSDRWLVHGEVVLVEDGSATRLATNDVDVVHLAWRDGTTLVFTGERGLDHVIGTIDVPGGTVTEQYVTPASPGGTRAPALLPDGTYVTELTAWDVPTRLALVGDGVDRALHVFPNDVDPAAFGSERRVTWTAPDGLEIQGLLFTPAAGEAPFATVLVVHGGPVAREESRAPARQRFVTSLLSRGYAVLVPNVRGSSGRGQAYAELVVGDMGGDETTDHLAGLDAFVAEGIVDPERIGVMGGSHGGFMSSWLVTQAPERFAAACALSPVTDWRSQHFTSNIAHFDTLFVGPMDSPLREERSPLLHVGKVRTPTFLSAGTEDRCTPPGQALEFHQALLERGVPTACAIYPGEGHGVRGYPGVLDWITRIVGWFEQWMPPKR